jgi:hypothetical protein
MAPKTPNDLATGQTISFLTKLRNIISEHVFTQVTRVQVLLSLG